MEQRIHQHFIKNHWTLALAESCTGGEIASRLVAIPNCSLYFQGSIVAYSNGVKEKILHVKPTTLQNKGAVSEQTALEMATGVLSNFQVQYALSSTGIAGPKGETTHKPIGTVCFAIVSLLKQDVTWTSHFKGSRRSITELAIADALEHLWNYIL